MWRTSMVVGSPWRHLVRSKLTGLARKLFGSCGRDREVEDATFVPATGGVNRSVVHLQHSIANFFCVIGEPPANFLTPFFLS